MSSVTKKSCLLIPWTREQNIGDPETEDLLDAAAQARDCQSVPERPSSRRTECLPPQRSWTQPKVPDLPFSPFDLPGWSTAHQQINLSRDAAQSAQRNLCPHVPSQGACDKLEKASQSLLSADAQMTAREKGPPCTEDTTQALIDSKIRPALEKAGELLSEAARDLCRGSKPGEPGCSHLERANQAAQTALFHL